MKTRSILILVFVVALLAGFTYIILNNRAVDQLNSSTQKVQTELTSEVNPEETTDESTANEAESYTLAEVSTHKTETDCWTTINGSVYDLTSWVSRHPGGPQGIIGLCGIDGTSAFTKQHGNSPKPQSALVLLKIGTLKS